MDIAVAVALGLVASPFVIWAWRKLLPASTDAAQLSTAETNRCRKAEFEATVFMFAVAALLVVAIGGNTTINATSGLMFIASLYSAYFLWLVVRVLVFQEQRTAFLSYVERRYRISRASYLLMGLISMLVLLIGCASTLFDSLRH